MNLEKWNETSLVETIKITGKTNLRGRLLRVVLLNRSAKFCLKDFISILIMLQKQVYLEKTGFGC